MRPGIINDSKFIKVECTWFSTHPPCHDIVCEPGFLQVAIRVISPELIFHSSSKELVQYIIRQKGYKRSTFLYDNPNYHLIPAEEKIEEIIVPPERRIESGHFHCGTSVQLCTKRYLSSELVPTLVLSLLLKQQNGE